MPASKYKKWTGAILLTIGFLGLVFGPFLLLVHLLFRAPIFVWRTVFSLTASLPLIVIGSYLLNHFQDFKLFLTYSFASSLSVIPLFILGGLFLGVPQQEGSHTTAALIISFGGAILCWYYFWRSGGFKRKK